VSLAALLGFATSALAQTPTTPEPMPFAALEMTAKMSATAPAPLAGEDGESAAPQSPEAAPASKIATVVPPASAPIGGVQQIGCSSCSGGLLGIPAPPLYPPPMGCDSCTTSPCYPGRQQCHPCLAQTCVGRCFCGLYECICCPDPCYEPRWLAVADAAFFVDAARPQTQMRFRWDSGVNLILPDRNEYFWARADGKGKGPPPPAPFKVVPRLSYNDLSMYTEAGTGTASVMVELPYRSIDEQGGLHAAGFADMMIGPKTLLFDCELLQVALEMKTYIPMGNFNHGLGTGHVSLEPSLVVGVKLAPETYFQGQLAEWIPLGGDSNYQGAILNYHMSINQVLFRVLPDVPLIGTLELSGWSFQTGAYTDPLLGSFQHSGGETYLMPGFGLRLVFCDKIDFGFGAEFAVTERHFAEQLYRTEFRFRF
jgi:hypothetical protein